MSLSNFRYVEIVRDGIFNRGNIVELPEGTSNFDLDYFEKGEVIDGYHSVFMHTQELFEHAKTNKSVRGYNGSCFCDYLFWDMDSESIEQAKQDTIALVGSLSEYTGSNNIRIYFSGGKGFHLFLRTHILHAFVNRREYNVFIKNVCSNLACGLKSFDNKIYDKTRIVRTPNSRHGKTGLYKVELTYEALCELSINGIIEYAKQQRPSFYQPDGIVSDKLIDTINRTAEDIPTQERVGVGSSGLLDGIKYGFESGTRNSGMASVAGLLHSRNLDSNFIKSILVNINTNNSPPLEEREINSIIESIQKYPINPEYADIEANEIATIKDASEEWYKIIKSSGYTSFGNRFPHINQRMKICIPGDVVAVVANSGVGKAQPLWSNVLTPTGFVNIEKINVDDLVIGQDGKPHRVVATKTFFNRPIYTITFKDKTTVDCDVNHLWKVQQYNNNRTNLGTTVLDCNTIKNNIKNGYVIGTPINECVDFTGTTPIDPYLLGALLGDGSFRNHCIIFTNSDNDIVSRVNNVISSFGCNFKQYRTGHYRISKIEHSCANNINKKTNKNIIAEFIDSVGLLDKKSHEKFIPKNFLLSSKENRLNLLRGLCDTDGYCAKKTQVEYSTTSQRLKDDIMFLVRSLGGVAYYYERVGAYKKNGVSNKTRINYRVYFSLPDGVNPFFCERKSKKYGSGHRQKKNKFIKCINFSGYTTTKCIQIDSCDGLYITDGFSVTHNSTVGLELGNNEAKERNMYSLIASLEMSRAGLFFRAATIESTKHVNHHVPSDQVVKDLLEEQELKDRVLKEWSSLLVVDRGNITIDQVAEFFQLAQKKYNNRVSNLVIDYAQNLQGAEEIEYAMRMARQMKTLAKSLNTKLFVLMQCNKTMPHDYLQVQKNHIEGAGAYFQACDYIMGFWRSRDENNRIHGCFIKDRWGSADFQFDLVREGLKYHSEDYREDSSADMMLAL